MLFNSVDFLIFLPIVFFLYWFAAKGNLKLQNILLLVASYFFYACWDWRFLFLLIFSTVLDYSTGIKMFEAKTKGMKKFWFWLSVGVNLGFLGVFKYYNFFVESMSDALHGMGFEAHFWTLQIILPVGISFYTFHGLSYVIDIYKDKIKPERNFIDYSVFVSFFPLLVAGPIERATHLLPQIQTKRQFNYTQAIDGLRQILWGLFKKIVIADNCAEYANMVFSNSGDFSGSTHLLGVIYFTFQIYGDFSGYSDIALGTARLFGVELLRNFAYPFFSRDTAEYWRRWHISLSSWFRDYLYIPLGGSKGGTWMKVRNTFIIFVVSGFWHGAAWTYVIWGFLNALYIMPSIIFNTNRNNLETVAQGRMFPTLKELYHILATFSLTVFAFIIFRATDMHHAFTYMAELFSPSLFTKPQGIQNYLVWLLVIFFAIEWIGREHKYALERFGMNWPKPLRLSFYLAIVFAIFWFKPVNDVQFIYFQF
ncbi:MBOAT family O-acyltransferase [Flavobacterium sp.]|uniref:MBOAT family O-acyltransferase n=1 Tax=Flavobacterium sp. TaxID=239 RepID=UPI0039E3BD62